MLSFIQVSKIQIVRIHEAVVLPQPVSILMSTAHVVTKDHIDAWGLDHNLWPWGYLRTVRPPETCWSERPVLSPMVMVSPSGTGLLLTTLSGSMVSSNPGLKLWPWILLPLRDLQMARVWSATWDHVRQIIFKHLLQLVCYLCLSLQRPSKSRRE